MLSQHAHRVNLAQWHHKQKDPGRRDYGAGWALIDASPT